MRWGTYPPGHPASVCQWKNTGWRGNWTDIGHKSQSKQAPTQPLTAMAPRIILCAEKGRYTFGHGATLVPPHETKRKGPPDEAKNRPVQNSEVQPEPTRRFSISNSCSDLPSLQLAAPRLAVLVPPAPMALHGNHRPQDPTPLARGTRHAYPLLSQELRWIRKHFPQVISHIMCPLSRQALRQCEEVSPSGRGSGGRQIKYWSCTELGLCSPPPRAREEAYHRGPDISHSTRHCWLRRVLEEGFRFTNIQHVAKLLRLLTLTLARYPQNIVVHVDRHQSHVYLYRRGETHCAPLFARESAIKTRTRRLVPIPFVLSRRGETHCAPLLGERSSHELASISCVLCQRRHLENWILAVWIKQCAKDDRRFCITVHALTRIVPLSMHKLWSWFDHSWTRKSCRSASLPWSTPEQAL